MFYGTEVELGGKKWTVPAISLDQLRNGGIELLKKHDELVKEDDGWLNAFELKGKIICMAMQRNYPDLTEADVFSWLDMSNANTIWLMVLGASGLSVGEVTRMSQETASGTSAQSTEV